MSYQRAIEAAGATVHEFKEFGSYQGEWWALVTYNGDRCWVNGSYGSCSGCDSFEAEFGWGELPEKVGEDFCPLGSYEYRAATEADVEEALKKLAAFGKPYLEGSLSQDQAEKAAAENIEWDSEAEEMLAFIKENAITEPTP